MEGGWCFGVGVRVDQRGGGGEYRRFKEGDACRGFV